MTELLIKGIHMPKGDEILRLEILPNGQVNRIIGWAISEKKNAKAIELSSHGELVDRNLLKGTSYEIMRFPDNEAVEMYQELIDNAPTVVEASDAI